MAHRSVHQSFARPALFSRRRLFPRLGPATQGTAALEFAIAVPVLLLLLTGVVSFGVGLRVKMEVGNAARAGAAFASLHGYDTSGIATAANSATSLANVDVTAAETVPGCTSAGSPTITPAGSAKLCPDGAAPGTYVRVTARTNYTAILPAPGLPTTAALSATAVARIR